MSIQALGCIFLRKHIELSIFVQFLFPLRVWANNHELGLFWRPRKFHNALTNQIIVILFHRYKQRREEYSDMRRWEETEEHFDVFPHDHIGIRFADQILWCMVSPTLRPPFKDNSCPDQPQCDWYMSHSLSYCRCVSAKSHMFFFYLFASHMAFFH